MLNQTALTGARRTLLAGMLASGILASPLGAQSPVASAKPEVVAGASEGTPVPAAAPYRNQSSRLTRQQAAYYGIVWGVDSLSVKWVESGEILRFAYRVVDADKARVLNDKKVDPVLIDPEKGVKLVIPSLEKVGQLRQTSSAPVEGKSYWMAFSNAGRPVKRGDRVNVVIGNFRAQGLIVE